MVCPSLAEHTGLAVVRGGAEKNQSGNSSGEQNSGRLRCGKLNCSPAQPSTAVWKMGSVIWRVQLPGVWPSFFSIISGSGVGNISSGNLPHYFAFVLGATWCVGMVANLSLCGKTTLERLASCPCHGGPHAHDLQGVSASLSLCQEPPGTKLRWWAPFCWQSIYFCILLLLTLLLFAFIKLPQPIASAFVSLLPEGSGCFEQVHKFQFYMCSS